ncbi:MAG: hypothetical protein R3E31_01145 [Chloroflexota bacterium]
MAADGSELHRLPTPIGSKTAPSWSPDGRWIAYIGTEGEGVWWKNSSLWLIPSNGSSDARNPHGRGGFGTPPMSPAPTQEPAK